MKYAKFSDDFLSYFILDDNGETLVLTDKRGYFRAVKLLPYEERPRGKWIDAYPEIEKNPMFEYGICSHCKFEQSMSNKLNFCPNCGADMRGDKEE